MTTYRSAEGFHPGEILREELEERGWSQLDLATITGEHLKAINEVVNEKRSITPSFALALEKALGPSMEFWLNLQTHFDAWKTRANERGGDEISRKAALYVYPIREMGKRGWIDDSSGPDILEKELCRFFEEESFESLKVAAKRSNPDETLSPLQIAWLYRAKHLASALAHVPPFSKKKLVSSIENLRSLLHTPEETINASRILSEAGIRFVVVEALPGLKLDGACFWIGESPAIALSLRLDKIDNFWFVLRHEIEHVLRGDAKGKDISQIVPDAIETTLAQDSITGEAEQAANDAAADFCVPRDKLAGFINRMGGYFSSTRIAAFAHLNNVHPGIVVGQLHNSKKLPHKNLRKYLVKVREYVIETALSDGWGNIPQLD